MQFTKAAQKLGSQAPVDGLSSSARDLDCAHWSYHCSQLTTVELAHESKRLKPDLTGQTEQMEF